MKKYKCMPTILTDAEIALAVVDHALEGRRGSNYRHEFTATETHRLRDTEHTSDIE